MTDSCEYEKAQQALTIFIKCSYLVSKLGVEQKQQGGAAEADMLTAEPPELLAAMEPSENKYTCKKVNSLGLVV